MRAMMPASGHRAINGRCLLPLAWTPSFSPQRTKGGAESGSGYLVGNKLTVADIAVGGTLSLLPQVAAPTTGLGPWKALAGYVLRLARRPAYRRAFGDETTDLVLEKFEGFLAEEVAPPKEKPPGYGAFMKLFEAIADPFFKYIYSADGR
eukprot:CAMPEP_0206414632 /NCGR_PEP_ID=MMETSP0294-20121207/35523_1 /ASSEMBLY_ACC=CAM_ASM_000327 /TAXON_ID=39354 /ORGANISM="Heterosigma akashiwo, Strain CCMP2393" /LENGTH=149 /DNA_ID=CAMNT_0053876645 /DNA_START=265 /DNA_END=714 /DNA_ORIENTATION=-